MTFLKWMLVLVTGVFLTSSALAEDSSNEREQLIDSIREIRKIVTDDGVERLETVTLGGLDQWVSVRGKDRANPVLLFLHGGPGFATMPMSWAYQNGWEDYFTVVQWDQRGAGKTYAMHDPDAVAPTITKDRIVADTVELIEWLRTEYKQEKVILVGLSWGSVVGLEVARTRPELLHAYVGLGQVIDFEENEKQGWAFAMARATEEENRDAIRDLEKIAPYPTASSEPSSLYTQRRWVEYYGGAMHNRKGYGAAISSVELSPDYSDAEVAAFLEAPDATFPILFRELMAYDASGVRTLDCPIVLFLGRHDYNVVSAVSAEWLARLQAPWKDLVWFENSSHVVMMEEPGRTLVELVNRVRPLALPDDRSR